MSRNKIVRSGSLLAWVLVVGLVALGAVMIYQPYLMRDLVVSSTYQPTAEVQQILAKLDLNPAVTKTVYASRPEVNNADQFNQNCQQREASVAILGCFANSQIFVYQVTDANLNGVMEATMAHEVLHAVYQRLPASEKERINGLLEENYRLNKNPELDKRLELYAKIEPGERANELHSILGSEFKNLTPELETYYQQIFKQRQTVTGFYQQYASRFIDLNQQLDQIKSELTSLEQAIVSQRNNYEAESESLNADINDFNQRANSGYFNSQKDFEAQRQKLLERSGYLEGQFTAINQSIDQYNKLAADYNRLSDQLASLNEGINSMSKVKQPTAEAI